MGAKIWGKVHAEREVEATNWVPTQILTVLQHITQGLVGQQLIRSEAEAVTKALTRLTDARAAAGRRTGLSVPY